MVPGPFPNPPLVPPIVEINVDREDVELDEFWNNLSRWLHTFMLFLTFYLTDLVTFVNSVYASLNADIGVVKAWGGTVVPLNHLLCDGSAISRSTYLQLFQAIGTKWGVGDGSTTFNLPLPGTQAFAQGGTNSIWIIKYQ